MSASAYESALEAALRAVQVSVPYASRNKIFEIIRDVLREQGLARRFAPDPGLAASLEDDGLAPFAPLLSPIDADAVRSHLEGCPVFSSHIAARSDRVPRRLEEAQRFAPIASYRLEDLVTAPKLLDLANDPGVLAIAESYLGCTPTIYSMNAVWTFPLAPGEVQTQFFHRDNDDFRFCTLFIILTESTGQDGAHLFVRKTHSLEKLNAWHSGGHQDGGGPGDSDIDLDSIFNEFEIDRDYLQILISSIFSKLITPVHGPAGTSFIADTFGFHRGEAVRTNRLLFWVRYGLYRNFTLAADGIQPVSIADAPVRSPRDEYFRYTNRCIARL